MDSIIDQMMTVAEYIGWETKELRPVSLVINRIRVLCHQTCTEIGKKTWPFAKLQPGRARKRINAT